MTGAPLAYNRGNFPLATSEPIEEWSLISLFQEILQLIAERRPQPPPALA